MKRDPVTAGAILLSLLAVVTASAAGEDHPSATSQGTSPAATSEEVAALRREVEALRETVRALHEKIQALQAAGAGQPAAAPPVEIAPPPAPPEPPTRSPNLMNPAISAVFQATGNTSLARSEEENGFDLSEAEIAFQSVVDPYAKVDLFLSFPAGETPEVEEGVVSTLSLPGSLQIRGGRFKSAFGKWNTLHSHAFFSVDRPNALVNFLGEESLTNDGMGLSVLVPNPWDFYLESITEAGTPQEGPAFNSENRSLAYLEHLTFFFNTGADSTLEFGLTGSWGKTGPPETLLAALSDPNLSSLRPDDRFDSAVQGLDLTYKWKPLGMNVYRSFLWQTEVLRSRRDLQVLTPSSTLIPGSVTSYGGYTYLESQFFKRFRVGLRYDRSGLPDDDKALEWAGSAVVRFQPSEFQEIRFQIKHTRRNEEAALRFGGDEDDTRIFFEWIPVIGAHGAHKY